MRKTFWFTACVVALTALASGCSHQDTAPAAATKSTIPDSAVFSSASVDPSLSASAGQASLPGLTMEPTSTYTGDVAPATTTNPCTYDASAGRVVCTPVVREGLTYTRSYAYYDTAGKAQPAPNAATRSMNTQIGVKGTRTTAKGDTVSIDRSSNTTLSGLGKGVATHTINGTEHGTTTSSYTIYWGKVSATETFDVVTKDVVVQAEAKSRWPLSGSTSRTSTTVATLEKTLTRTATSSETVTYNGTSVVPVVIVRDGVTHNCTRDLSTGKNTCS